MLFLSFIVYKRSYKISFNNHFSFSCFIWQFAEYSFKIALDWSNY